jgi:undecaprenyl-diphosphatase
MIKSLLETVMYLDYIVWGYLNVRWHNGFMDVIMPFLRNQWFWAPLYLFLLLFMPRRFGRNGWIWCSVFLITFGISDQLSATLLKPLFGRIRPCNDPYFSGIVHIIVPCGGGKSFPSSHAANHFSLAVFSAISLRHLARWVWPLALAWAIVVSYSQVYVGVHYPLDVLCGGLLGAVVGWGTGNAFNRRIELI